MSDRQGRNNQSPRINESDYRAPDRNSVGKKKIFDSQEKNPPTWWGCPRWGCLVVFFILFGVLTGLTTWLIVKNEAFNVNNPELKVQYDQIKLQNAEAKKTEVLDINRQNLDARLPGVQSDAPKHYRRNFHHLESIEYQ